MDWSQRKGGSSRSRRSRFWIARKTDQMEEKNGSSEVEIGEKDETKKQSKDLEFLSCMMQPKTADSDPHYIGIRRILLHRKADSGVISRRYDWRCNGKGYVAYRNFISKPRKWENLRTPSLLSSPGNRLIYWLMLQWSMVTFSKSSLASI